MTAGNRHGLRLLAATCTLALLATPVLACTWTWNAPATFTDGGPALPADIAWYRLYLNGVKFGPDIPGTQTTYSTQTPCQPGVYTVKAVGNLGLESAPSAPFDVEVLSAPSNLRVSSP